jgi:CRP-like cAMP-binding protein
LQQINYSGECFVHSITLKSRGLHDGSIVQYIRGILHFCLINQEKQGMEKEDIAPLTEHWLFDELPEDEFAITIKSLRKVAFQPGGVLLREGDASDGVYLIAAGTLHVTVTNEHGATFLSLIGPGQVVGELGALDGEPRSASAVAITGGLAYFVPTEEFLDLVHRSRRATQHLLMMLASRLRQTNERLMHLPPQGPVWRTMPLSP